MKMFIVVLKNDDSTITVDSKETFDSVKGVGETVKVHYFKTFKRLLGTGYKFLEQVNVAELEVNAKRIKVLGQTKE